MEKLGASLFLSKKKQDESSLTEASSNPAHDKTEHGEQAINYDDTDVDEPPRDASFSEGINKNIEVIKRKLKELHKKNDIMAIKNEIATTKINFKRKLISKFEQEHFKINYEEIMLDALATHLVEFALQYIEWDYLSVFTRIFEAYFKKGQFCLYYCDISDLLYVIYFVKSFNCNKAFKFHQFLINLIENIDNDCIKNLISRNDLRSKFDRFDRYYKDCFSSNDASKNEFTKIYKDCTLEYTCGKYDNYEVLETISLIKHFILKHFTDDEYFSPNMLDILACLLNANLNVFYINDQNKSVIKHINYINKKAKTSIVTHDIFIIELLPSRIKRFFILYQQEYAKQIDTISRKLKKYWSRVPNVFKLKDFQFLNLNLPVYKRVYENFNNGMLLIWVY